MHNVAVKCVVFINKKELITAIKSATLACFNMGYWVKSNHNNSNLSLFSERGVSSNGSPTGVTTLGSRS